MASWASPAKPGKVRVSQGPTDLSLLGAPRLAEEGGVGEAPCTLLGTNSISSSHIPPMAS